MIYNFNSLVGIQIKETRLWLASLMANLAASVALARLLLADG